MVEGDFEVPGSDGDEKLEGKLLGVGAAPLCDPAVGSGRDEIRGRILWVFAGDAVESKF